MAKAMQIIRADELDLVKVDEKERTDNEKGKYYHGDYYEIGHYTVENYNVYNLTDDSKTYSRINVYHTDYKEANDSYIPEIYFEDGIWGTEEKRFVIQTTAYGGT